ncbi:MAG: MarR family transcriptional regulator [Chloroflexi bacterium]|nr:MarR family transcriptional regulator [Chloroflexota bacterium]MBP8058429.1 MarR family transcriptional regulator [Chloroflexota bacterium]
MQPTHNPMTQNKFTRPTPEQQEQWRCFWQTLSPNTDHRTMRLVGLLHRTAHTLRQVSENGLAEAGLSYAQYRILMLLLFAEQFEHQPAMNPSELSEQQGISRNTVSSLIGNLEKEGLIERELDREDKRRFLIKITERGRELVHTYAQQHFHNMETCLSNLQAEEKEMISHLLEKLNEKPTP